MFENIAINKNDQSVIIGTITLISSFGVNNTNTCNRVSSDLLVWEFVCLIINSKHTFDFRNLIFPRSLRFFR